MMVRVTGKVIFPFWNRTLRFETPALTAIAAGSSCTSNDVSMNWEDAPTFGSPARFNSRQPVFEWFLAFPPRYTTRPCLAGARPPSVTKNLSRKQYWSPNISLSTPNIFRRECGRGRLGRRHLMQSQRVSDPGLCEGPRPLPAALALPAVSPAFTVAAPGARERNPETCRE